MQQSGLDREQNHGGLRLRRTGLVIAAMLVSINIWTGAPLFALWVSSRVVPYQGAAGVSMTAVVIVVLVLAVTVFALAATLTRLNTAYDELTGRPMEVRRTSPWLRSMRGEREDVRRRRSHSSAVEVMVVLSVVGAVLAFEVWLLLFAHAVIPGVNG